MHPKYLIIPYTNTKQVSPYPYATLNAEGMEWKISVSPFLTIFHVFLSIKCIITETELTV